MIGRSNVLRDGWTTNENKVDQKQKLKGLIMYYPKLWGGSLENFKVNQADGMSSNK